MFRRGFLAVLVLSTMVFVGCFANKKVTNPIADVNSKQPDKVLYDRAMDAMKHNKFDVARLSLQTLINTYPDSEYVARAKLAIGDSWYAEGGSAAMAQAESEYKDFITFFPNMTEASEAQMKIANIHYNEMEKADRDYTHAKRAEEEYRQLIMQFPDSPLVPEAKKKLLSVQELLAEREFVIGHFYFMREAWPAAIARMKSLVDTYPLYSGADEALFEMGNAYERQADLLRRSRIPEAARAGLLKQYTDQAASAYDQILTRYPEEDRAGDAAKRLEAMGKPVPKATPAAIAQNKKEQESRGSLSRYQEMMLNFKKNPDLSQATKVGEPTLVDPKQTSAPELVRAASANVMSALASATASNAVAGTAAAGTGTAPPPENGPAPRSDAGTASAVAGGTAATTGTNANAAAEIVSAPSSAPPAGGIEEMGNDLKAPAAAPAADGTAQPLAPTQVNDAPKAATSESTSATADAASQQATPADSNTESSSKKKKKKHLLVF
ncbi:MAG TPA: outer membrane protein assembly factor BamD [Candidatus Angelobacter sp.]|jgi:outer membrane protein assembly factor BamD|nr:outer membrane protein assembly factor BamD [Candidatus Angelobacter sp.]